MFYSLCRLGLIIAVGLTLSFGVHAQSGDQLEKRMQLLNLLDQLDEDDFDRSLNAANNCIAVRDFSCARFNLKNAETYSLTPEHDEQLYAAQQRLGAAIEYVRQEQALALRMAEEEKARERERRAFEEEMERERERIAREAEEAEYYDYEADDSNDGWNTVLAISNAYVDTMREQNNRRAEQILAQQRAQQALEARERDRQAEQERQFQQQQRERQRRMDEIESQLKARQEAFAARQREESRRAAEQRAEQLRASRQAEQRAQQLRASSQARSAATTESSSSGRSDNGPQYTGKLYEPNPVKMTGNADSGFQTREGAVSQARLEAVNDITAECRARGARSDGPRFKDISAGIAPPRWNYAAPDCRQGGWKGEEWYCTATVSGTCYRNQ